MQSMIDQMVVEHAIKNMSENGLVDTNKFVATLTAMLMDQDPFFLAKQRAVIENDVPKDKKQPIKDLLTALAESKYTNEEQYVIGLRVLAQHLLAESKDRQKVVYLAQ